MFSIGFLLWAVLAALLTIGFGFWKRGQLQLVSAALLFVGFYLLAWLMLPPLAFDMSETWAMFVLVSVSAAGVTTLLGAQKERYTLWPIWIVPVVAFLILVVIGPVISSGVFNAHALATVAPITNNGTKERVIALVSQEKAQRVTSGLAFKRASEQIGAAAEPGLASRAKFGEIYANVTAAGEPLWVVPLVHTGFWRWLSNETTPGYFQVSHIQDQAGELVEDKPIRYGSEGFYWNHDLNRHLYRAGYIQYSFGEAFFQIDDAGVPYYVVPLERPQVGFFAYWPERWLIVNATTGAITEANSVEEIPTWVDRAFSQEVVFDRLKDWGCFTPGWWACYFSKENVISPTPGVVVTMDSQDTMIYVTGTQFAASNNEATSGVTTVNARTGDMQYYSRSGITETTAINTLNGAVANFTGWRAENPVLIQVNGIETYFAVIVDESGARKQYGLVSQRSRDVYGTGGTVSEAVRKYLKSASSNRNLGAFEGNFDVEETLFNGKLVSMRPIIQDGETFFYVRLDTVTDKIFVVSGRDAAEVAVSVVGELMRISTYNPEPAMIEANTVDNLSITLKESEIQEALDERAVERVQ